jgi:spore coat protein U-like protein
MKSIKRLTKHSLKHVIALGLGLLAFLVTAAPALAATATSNMSVTASVSGICTISAGTLAFGAYNPVSAAPVDGTATVTVACTSGLSAAITLGQGANADTGSSDAAPLRRMTDDGTNFLSYSLFQDDGRTVIWGNNTATDVEIVGTGVGFTVFGRITAGQTDVPVGNYSDTVVATVTF